MKIPTFTFWHPIALLFVSVFGLILIIFRVLAYNIKILWLFLQLDVSTVGKLILYWFLRIYCFICKFIWEGFQTLLFIAIR